MTSIRALALVVAHAERHRLTLGQTLRQPEHVELLAAREAERRGVLAGLELERQDAHADQVGAVDALVALGKHGTNAEQRRALGRPVTRRAAAVFASRDDQQGSAFALIAQRGVVDEHLVAARLVRRVRPFLVGQRVAQPDVAECAAHHHLVMAAARAVRVELERPDAVLLEPLTGRAPGRDRPGRGDVVGRDGITQDGEDARALDVVDRCGRARDAIEERRPRDVGRVRVPVIAARADRHRQCPPLIVAVEDGRVDGAEDVR